MTLSAQKTRLVSTTMPQHSWFADLHIFTNIYIKRSSASFSGLLLTIRWYRLTLAFARLYVFCYLVKYFLTLENGDLMSYKSTRELSSVPCFNSNEHRFWKSLRLTVFQV